MYLPDTDVPELHALVAHMQCNDSGLQLIFGSEHLTPLRTTICKQNLIEFALLEAGRISAVAVGLLALQNTAESSAAQLRAHRWQLLVKGGEG